MNSRGLMINLISWVKCPWQAWKWLRPCRPEWREQIDLEIVHKRKAFGMRGDGISFTSHLATESINQLWTVVQEFMNLKREDLMLTWSDEFLIADQTDDIPETKIKVPLHANGSQYAEHELNEQSRDDDEEPGVRVQVLPQLTHLMSQRLPYFVREEVDSSHRDLALITKELYALRHAVRTTQGWSHFSGHWLGQGGRPLCNWP